jgi:hypothetical protein
VAEQFPALTGDKHDCLLPDLNHPAFHVPSRPALETLVAEAPEHGCSLLFPDRHPFAGGTEHYAAYLENTDGFEVELVATSTCAGAVTT